MNAPATTAAPFTWPAQLSHWPQNKRTAVARALRDLSNGAGGLLLAMNRDGMQRTCATSHPIATGELRAADLIATRDGMRTHRLTNLGHDARSLIIACGLTSQDWQTVETGFIDIERNRLS